MKFTTTFLVGSIVAVAPDTPGPSKPSLTAAQYQWPSVIADPVDSANKILATLTPTTFKPSGLYGCFRSGYQALPTQTIKNNTAVASVSNPITSVTASKTGTRAFYAHTITQVGVPIIPIPVAATLATANQNFLSDSTILSREAQSLTDYYAFDKAAYECCPHDVTNATNSVSTMCASLISFTQSQAGTLDETENTHLLQIKVADRIVVVNDTGHYTIPSGSTDTDWSDTLTYDPDFVLGSFSQLSDDAATAENWCTAFKSTADSNTHIANIKLTANSKCTWQVQAAAGKAPSFKLSAAGNPMFLLQWIEWGLPTANLRTDDSSNVTGQLLPETETSPYIGDYAAADGVFFNPFTLGSPDTNEFDPSGNFATYPNTKPAGSIGDVEILDNAGTESIYTASQTVDSWNFISTISALQGTVTAHDAAVTAFNGLATTYNTAVDAYNKDLEDGVAEDEMTLVPTKPCAPAAVSPTFDATWILKNDAFDPAADFAAETMYVKTIGYDITDGASATPTKLDQTDSEYVRIQAGHRFGYTEVETHWDETALESAKVAKSWVAADNGYAGHTFGRMGQGMGAMPANTTPYLWYEDGVAGKTITALPGMQISVLPESKDFELTGSETITVNSYITTLATAATLGLQSAGASATALTEMTGAKALALSVMSMVAVAALVQ